MNESVPRLRGPSGRMVPDWSHGHCMWSLHCPMDTHPLSPGGPPLHLWHLLFHRPCTLPRIALSSNILPILLSSNSRNPLMHFVHFSFPLYMRFPNFFTVPTSKWGELKHNNKKQNWKKNYFFLQLIEIEHQNSWDFRGKEFNLLKCLGVWDVWWGLSDHQGHFQILSLLYAHLDSLSLESSQLCNFLL